MATLPNLDSTLGALFIGFSVSMTLYGMFLVQVYNYYRRYPSDKAGYKVVVVLLLLLETAHQALAGHTVYYYTITNFLNTLILIGKPIGSLVFQVITGATVGSLVRFCFTLRVWRFSKGNVWVTAFLLLLNFGQLGAAIAFAVESYGLPALANLVNIRVMGSVALGISVLDDIGIAVTLCYYLQAMRCGYTHTNSLVRRLTIYAVNTGALTSAMSFSTLITYNVMPGNLIHTGCYTVLSKLYAISFVAALNTRKTIPGRGTTDSEAGRSSSLRRSLKTPLHSPTVIEDSQNVESPGGKEQAGVSTPGFNGDLVVCRSPDSIWTAHQHRPRYTVGW